MVRNSVVILEILAIGSTLNFTLRFSSFSLTNSYIYFLLTIWMYSHKENQFLEILAGFSFAKSVLRRCYCLLDALMDWTLNLLGDVNCENFTSSWEVSVCSVLHKDFLRWVFRFLNFVFLLCVCVCGGGRFPFHTQLRTAQRTSTTENRKVSAHERPFATEIFWVFGSFERFSKTSNFRRDRNCLVVCEPEAQWSKRNLLEKKKTARKKLTPLLAYAWFYSYKM